MEKFLIRDHDGPVIQLHSRQELEKELEKSSDPSKVRIWIFDQLQWISYSQFMRQFPKSSTQPATVRLANHESRRAAERTGKQWLKKFLFFILIVTVGLLVINFTRISWEKQENIQFRAVRPANVPLMNIDSLITEIEMQRGQRLDRSTRVNFRTRNTWPDRILLNLDAGHETSRNKASRFSQVKISLDNASGFQIDNAVVRFTVWEKNKPNHTDTLHFNSVGYEQPTVRELNNVFRGDSLSISFESVRAQSFNFCYSSTTRNPGNYNDRWFCKDEQ